jgi:hypothetical protein
MSTKTTFKRIALVTVAALGFGVLTSVAPSSAAIYTDKTLVSAVSFGDAIQATRLAATTVARVGVSTANTVKLTIGSNLTVAAATEIQTYVSFKSVPAGETLLGTSSGSGVSPVLTTGAISAGSLASAAVTPTIVGASGVTPAYIQVALAIKYSALKSFE